MLNLKPIKGFSQFYTDGLRVFTARGVAIPAKLDGTYKLVADGETVKLTTVSGDFALSAGEKGVEAPQKQGGTSGSKVKRKTSGGRTSKTSSKTTKKDTE